MNIYFFEEPTIGYCPDCEKEAVYSIGKGLYCPNCKTQDLSIFIYDKNTKYLE